MNERVQPSNLKEMLLWVLRRRRRYQVTGDSMAPLFATGDQLLVDPHAYRLFSPQPGDVVVAKHPYRSDVRLVKRVRAVDASGRVALEGDNRTESTDSRSFGKVTGDRILGRVTSKFS